MEQQEENQNYQIGPSGLQWNNIHLQPVVLAEDVANGHLIIAPPTGQPIRPMRPANEMCSGEVKGHQLCLGLRSSWFFISGEP